MKAIRARPTATIAVSLTVLAFDALGADPPSPVTAHRVLWPDTISSAADFDRASRAEILVFARALAASEDLDAAALQSRLRIGDPDSLSVAHVRRRLWRLLDANYRMGAAHCRTTEPFCPDGENPADLRRAAGMLTDASIPERYAGMAGESIGISSDLSR